MIGLPADASARIGGAVLVLAALAGCAAPPGEEAAGGSGGRTSAQASTSHAGHGWSGPPLGTPPPSADPEFAQVCREAPGTTDPYFGTRQVGAIEERLRQALARPDVAPDLVARLEVVLSQENLRLGRVEEALKLLEKSRTRLAGVPPGAGVRLGVLMQSGVASLRLGEVRNCQLGHTPQSCILPIRTGGIHRDRRGSEQAIGFFAEVLEQRPDDIAARYLLNLAYMTLGEWPGGVPEPFRLPEKTFAPEADIGFFESVGADRGLDVWSLAGGAIVEDLTGDRRLDILFSAMDPCSPLRLFQNDGGGRFTDISGRSGVSAQLGGLNMVQADYDNDGQVDVLVLRGGWQGGSPLGRQRKSLLRNLGDGRFVDVTRQAGLDEPRYATQSAAWGDYDLDGNLDLYVCTEGSSAGMGIVAGQSAVTPGQLFHSRGDGTFEEVATAAGVENLRFCKGAVWGDYDNDGDPDLYVSNFGVANRLYRNEGNGRFTDVAETAGVTAPVQSFPTWFWDYDNDGRLDIFAGAFNPDPRPNMAEYVSPPGPGEFSKLYRNRGDGTFEDVSERVGIRRARMMMGANFGDLDNDGWLDFYCGTGSPNFEALLPKVMYRSDAGRRFQDVSGSGFGHLQKGHGVAFGDLDEDGDQDVVEELGGAFADDAYANAVYLNPGHGNHFVNLFLEGKRSNRLGEGARIRVVIQEDGKRREIHRVITSGSSFGDNPLRAEIGLGRATAIESVEVRWPVRGGTVQVYRGVKPDASWLLREGEERPLPLEPGA